MEKIATMIPHVTHSRYPKPKVFCYMEYVLRSKAAEHLLNAQNYQNVRNTLKDEDHVTIIRQGLNAKLKKGGKAPKDPKVKLVYDNWSEYSRFVMEIREIVKNSIEAGTEENNALVGVGKVPIDSFLGQLEYIKYFPQLMSKIDHTFFALTSGKATLGVAVTGDAMRNSYYVHGDSVNSAVRGVVSYMWGMTFGAKNKRQAARDDYYRTAVTEFVDLNTASLYFYAYCGCEFGAAWYSNAGFFFKDITCRFYNTKAKSWVLLKETNDPKFCYALNYMRVQENKCSVDSATFLKAFQSHCTDPASVGNIAL